MYDSTPIRTINISEIKYFVLESDYYFIVPIVLYKKYFDFVLPRHGKYFMSAKHKMALLSVRSISREVLNKHVFLFKFVYVPTCYCSANFSSKDRLYEKF